MCVFQNFDFFISSSGSNNFIYIERLVFHVLLPLLCNDFEYHYLAEEQSCRVTQVLECINILVNNSEIVENKG